MSLVYFGFDFNYFGNYSYVSKTVLNHQPTQDKRFMQTSFSLITKSS